MFEKIENDLFNIAQRLREIDASYRVFYNRARDRFEVHNGEYPCGRTLAFVVPFAALDVRTLDYAVRTRRENFDAVEREVSAHNAELEDSAARRMREAQSDLEDKLGFAMREDRTVDFSGGIKWF